MNEVMTMDEINARFDSEWVLIGDPEKNEFLEVTRGTLLWHDKDRDRVYEKAMELRPRNCAVLYIGTIPEDPVIITRLLVGFSAE